MNARNVTSAYVTHARNVVAALRNVTNVDDRRALLASLLPRTDETKLSNSSEHVGRPCGASSISADKTCRIDSPIDPERAPKIARLKQLGEEIKPLAQKGGLTSSEAMRFRSLNAEANGLRFQLARPLAIEKIPSPAERMSALPSEIVLTARNDLMRHREVYDPIVDAATGVSHNAETAVDDAMRGNNPKVSAHKFYGAFNDTRDAMRKHFGNSITLFRATGMQREKPTQNWATTKEYAAQFGSNVVSKSIPIDDVIAVNVGPFGKYHEVIVGRKPSTTETLTNARPNVSVTPTKRNAFVETCERWTSVKTPVTDGITCTETKLANVGTHEGVAKEWETRHAHELAEVESKANRFRPKEKIVFDKPLIGPNGSKLVAYEWKWQPEEYVDKYGEERIKRVSNWDEAETSTHTGRDIVHQFDVVKPDGESHTMSAESVPKALGYETGEASKVSSVVNASKTLAKLKMKLAVTEAKIAEYAEHEKAVKAMRVPEENIKSTPAISEDGLNKGKQYGTNWTLDGAWVFQHDDKPIDQERRETLIDAWRQQRMNERGAQRVYESTKDLKRRIERQEAKLKQAGAPESAVSNREEKDAKSIIPAPQSATEAIIAPANNAITNSGTSEGVSKSWETRHGESKNATQAANEASAYAHDHPEAQNDLKAQQAHEKAIVAHSEAESNAPSGGQKLYHDRMRKLHEVYAKWHGSQIDAPITMFNERRKNLEDFIANSKGTVAQPSSDAVPNGKIENAETVKDHESRTQEASTAVAAVARALDSELLPIRKKLEEIAKLSDVDEIYQQLSDLRDKLPKLLQTSNKESGTADALTRLLNESFFKGVYESADKKPDDHTKWWLFGLGLLAALKAIPYLAEYSHKQLEEIGADIEDRSDAIAKVLKAELIGQSATAIDTLLLTPKRDDVTPVTNTIRTIARSLEDVPPTKRDGTDGTGRTDVSGTNGADVTQTERERTDGLRASPLVRMHAQLNSDMANGFGRWTCARTLSYRETWPCDEFYRAEFRIEPRDWPTRWAAAGGEFYPGGGDYKEGRMVALVGDQIWTDISRWGTPYAPFDYFSGMDVEPIQRNEAIAIGAITADYKPGTIADRRFNDGLGFSPRVTQDFLAQLGEDLSGQYLST